MLTPADKSLIERFVAASEGLSAEVAAKALPEVSSATVRRYMDGDFPTRMTTEVRQALRKFLKVSERIAEETEGESVNETLDRWGFARARAVEGLVEMLREDKRILEMRAETALNASRAALLEAEKAPHRGVSLSLDQTEALHRLVEDLMSARKAAEAGDGGPSTGGPEPPGQQPPDGKG